MIIDEAIKYLAVMVEIGETYEVGKVVEENRQFLEWLKELKQLREQTRWIPVSERLPEDGERVLVTYDKIVIRATWDLMRYSFYDTHAVSLDKDFVYAWMPLPEPYRAEGSGEE